MKKSITIWAIENVTNSVDSLCEAALMAKEAGFDGLELSLEEQGCISLEASPEDLRQLLKKTRAAGCGLSSISTLLFNEVSLTANDNEERKYAQGIAMKMIECASMLEIRTISLSPGRVVPEVSYLSAYNRAIEQIGLLAERAKKAGVTVCIENVWQGLLLSPIEFAMFIDNIGSDAAAVCLDIGNTLLTGYPQHWVEILGKRIQKLHITDVRRRRGAFLEFVDPGKGDVDWKTVMPAISDTGFEGYGAIEAFYKKGQDDSARLHELCNSFNLILGSSI